jgi:transcriptional regulator NrdR family protein
MKAKVDIHQEKMEATVHSIQSKLEETIKHWVEDVLSCVDQKTQDLHKELNEKIDETWVDFQAVKMSLDTWNDLHEELGVMLQVEAQTTNAEIKIN